MSDTPPFNTEESAALLKQIFPEYPGYRNTRPAPKDVQEWLRIYREQKIQKQAVAAQLPHYG